MRKTEAEIRKEEIVREMYTDGLMTEHQLEKALDDVVVGDDEREQEQQRDLLLQQN